MQTEQPEDYDAEDPTVQDLLSELGDKSELVRYSGLSVLSGLSPEETADFKRSWPYVPHERRHQVLEMLVELSEDNLDLDFSGVFAVSLEDPYDLVREKAVRGLADYEDRTLIQPLVARLNEDPSPEVRAAAAASLGGFAVLARDGKLIPRDAEKVRLALIEAARRRSGDLEGRRRAIEAAAHFDGPDVDEIIRAAYQSGDAKLRLSSIFAMGQSSNARWLPTVLDEVDHEDAAVRYEAAVATGRLGEEDTAPALIKLIEDDDHQVQLAGVRALGAVGGGLAKRALLKCVELGDEILAEAAQEAIGNFEFDEDPLSFGIGGPQGEFTAEYGENAE